MPTYTPNTPRIRSMLAAVALSVATFAVAIVAPADLATPISSASVLAVNAAAAPARYHHAG